MELLEALLNLFTGKITGVDFRPAYPVEQGARRVGRPVVTGEIDGETVKPGSDELRLRFKIFLPAGTGASRGQEIFAAMCKAAGEAYPGFSAIARAAAQVEKTTGMLVIPCTLTFLTEESASPGETVPVTLGGREFQAEAVKLSIAFKGDDLTAIGEELPFAVEEPVTEYTVELDGIAPEGLESLARFTAEIGTPPEIYRRCRWKSISAALRRAVFVSREKA